MLTGGVKESLLCGLVYFCRKLHLNSSHWDMGLVKLILPVEAMSYNLYTVVVVSWK